MRLGKHSSLMTPTLESLWVRPRPISRIYYADAASTSFTKLAWPAFGHSSHQASLYRQLSTAGAVRSSSQGPDPRPCYGGHLSEVLALVSCCTKPLQ